MKWAVGASLLLAAIYMSVVVAQRPAPADSRLAGGFPPSSPPASPQVVDIPVPADGAAPAVPGFTSGSVESGPAIDDAAVVGEAPGDAILEPTPIPAHTLPPPISAAPVAPATSLPSVVATPAPLSDRQMGEVAFEKALIPLVEIADKADLAWARYKAGCRENVTATTARAAAGARVWFQDGSVIDSGSSSSASTYSSTWTETCAELGNVRHFSAQIATGMCEAEEEARRAGVYPGTIRALRAKYRLEWSWCS